MSRLAISIVSTAFLAGCATTPDVTLSYYPIKWNAVATITQTVGCNAGKTGMVTLNSSSVAASYSSDFTKSPFKIRIKDLDGQFNDAELKMDFTDDGRLKSINQSTTGQGETTVKAFVTAATAIAAMAAPVAPAVVLDECKIVESWGGGKPISLTYKATIDATKVGIMQPLDPVPESKELYLRLQKQLPKLTVNTNIASENKSGPSNAESPEAPRNNVLLDLQNTHHINVTMEADGDTIASARIVVPGQGTYQLPIPKAAFFGKQSFSLILSESGAVISAGYGKNAGTTGLLNAAGSIASAESETTRTSAKVAELKAQADLIAQQQRLVLCQTKPDQCK